jgi:hypothetical protein
MANSWNKFLSTLFFCHTYLYAWLNNCGLGKPSTRVYTGSHMKPLHHVHSLSICCVPATLLCPELTYHEERTAYQRAYPSIHER